MIYVSQGHERSISLEIFLKSFNQLPSSSHNNFSLIVNKNTLLTNLSFLDFDYSVDKGDHLIYGQSKLKCIFFENNNCEPESTLALNLALELISYERDILLTLPTSKDQLIINNTHTAGYTEFFRKRFDLDKLVMLFSSDIDKMMLVTDHVPLKDVAGLITSDLIFQKTSISLEKYPIHFGPFEEVFFAGLNPHSGEGGILGTEDSQILEAIEKLKVEFPNIKFTGPISADALHFHKNSNKSQLLVYMYHDQGLPLFKAQNLLIGLNITLGLPFLRISVDHGTAFELYGKNIADSSGCQYMLESAICAQNRIQGDK